MKKIININIVIAIIILCFSSPILADLNYFECECDKFETKGSVMENFLSNLKNMDHCRNQEFFVIDGDNDSFFARGTPFPIITNSSKKMSARGLFNEDMLFEFELTLLGDQWWIKEHFNFTYELFNYLKRDYRCELMSDKQVASSSPMSRWKKKLEKKLLNGREQLLEYCVNNGFENSDKGLAECGTFIQLQANLKNTQNNNNTNNNQNVELKSLTEQNQELLKKNQEMLRKARQIQHYQGLSRMMQSLF